MRNNYQTKDRKSNHKFEVVRGQELMVRVPLPMAEVWAELQAQVEELTGQAGLQILRAILGRSCGELGLFAPSSGTCAPLSVCRPTFSNNREH